MPVRRWSWIGGLVAAGAVDFTGVADFAFGALAGGFATGAGLGARATGFGAGAAGFGGGGGGFGAAG